MSKKYKLICLGYGKKFDPFWKIIITFDSFDKTSNRWSRCDESVKIFQNYENRMKLLSNHNIRRNSNKYAISFRESLLEIIIEWDCRYIILASFIGIRVKRRADFW